MNNNIDHHDEYFWITLKNIILNFSDETITNKINSLSKELNILQKEKKYSIITEKINNFLKENINILCILVFLSNTDPIYMSRFSSNLTKWKKIMKERNINLIFDSNYKFNIDILTIMSGYIDRKYQIYLDLYPYVRELISINFRDSLTELEINTIIELNHKIFVKSILLNAHNMVDYIKNHVLHYDLYFKNMLEFNKKKNTSCPKLISLIINNNTEHFNKIKKMVLSKNIDL